MEELNYFIIETGERLPTGIRVIKVSFDADEIAENREDGESDEDVVNYLLNLALLALTAGASVGSQLRGVPCSKIQT